MYAKRAFDIAGSTFGLVVLSPVFAAVATATALHFRQSPIFVIERFGKDEKPFKMFKFRSMTNAKDNEGNLLPDEQRRSKYGRFLRFTSLDELPQLFNILKGDMSFVGPRPVGMDQYKEIIENNGRVIFAVKPGLTGPWQVSAIGKKALPIEHKIALETKYAQQGRSLRDDVVLMFKTFPSFIKGHNSPLLKKKRAFGEISLKSDNEQSPVNSL